MQAKCSSKLRELVEALFFCLKNLRCDEIGDWTQTHRIHGPGIFTCIYPKTQINLQVNIPVPWNYGKCSWIFSEMASTFCYSWLVRTCWVKPPARTSLLGGPGPFGREQRKILWRNWRGQKSQEMTEGVFIGHHCSLQSHISMIAWCCLETWCKAKCRLWEVRSLRLAKCSLAKLAGYGGNSEARNRKLTCDKVKHLPAAYTLRSQRKINRLAFSNAVSGIYN